MKDKPLEQELAKAGISPQEFSDYAITLDELVEHNEVNRRAYGGQLEYNVGRCRFCGEYEIICDAGIHHAHILDDKLCPGRTHQYIPGWPRTL